MSAAKENRLFDKISWRILPLLATCWVVNWIDRINIGFAKLGFQKSFALSDREFGLVVGVYSIGYLLLEVPSNLLMQRIGARKTLSRILALWGLVTIVTAFARTSDQLAIARFLLGAAEAGFFPGALLYLSYWFPARRRARVTSRFIIANAVAGVLGGPISGLVLSKMGGILGLQGWQWLFLVEGAPPILLGAFVWLWLSDRPEDADWLSPQEKDQLARELQADRLADGERHRGFLHALADFRLYVLAVAFCLVIMCAGNVVQIWAPSIIKAAGSGGVAQIGFLSAIPWAIGIVGMLLVSASSDRLRERRWHFVCSALAVAAALAALPVLARSTWGAVFDLSVMTSAYLAAIVVFWTVAALYFSPAARAGSLALINTLGQFGGLFTPLLIGWASTKTGDLAVGVSVVGGVVLLGSIGLAATFSRDVLRESKPV
jgi:MFS transporter, ACS family, phthalate transporter